MKINNSVPIQMPEEFAKLLMVTQAHLGGVKVTKQMEEYIFGRRRDSITVFDLKKIWEKFVLAARIISGIDQPEFITAISTKEFGRKPVLKFADAISCRSYKGRFIPGSFTNRSMKRSFEPRLIVVSDPMVDRQAIDEAAGINCPSIAFCNTNADLKFVDVVIPINNRSPGALGACFFILARLVNYMKSGASLSENMKEVELFFHRDKKELEDLQNETETKIAFDNSEPEDNESFGRNMKDVPENSNEMRQ